MNVLEIAENYINIRNKKAFSEYYEVILYYFITTEHI